MSDPREGANQDYTTPLIEAMRADPQRAAYYLDLIEPLRSYDREHHGDLVRTLAAYLRQAGNAVQTANTLYIHRNSLRYRLARIQALTSLNPDDPDTRLALHIAVILDFGFTQTKSEIRNPQSKIQGDPHE